MANLRTKAPRKSVAQDRPARTQLARGGAVKTKPAATAPRRKRIGVLLVADGHVEPAHVTEALEVQQRSGGKMVEILIKLGHLDAQSFARFIATSYVSTHSRRFDADFASASGPPGAARTGRAASETETRAPSTRAVPGLDDVAGGLMMASCVDSLPRALGADRRFHARGGADGATSDHSHPGP